MEQALPTLEPARWPWEEREAEGLSDDGKQRARR